MDEKTLEANEYSICSTKIKFLVFSHIVRKQIKLP